MNRFDGNGRPDSSIYVTAIRAVIESAVVTWVGIVLCEIGLLAPTGHITVRPIFFLVYRWPLKAFRRTKIWEPLYLMSYPISS